MHLAYIQRFGVRFLMGVLNEYHSKYRNTLKYGPLAQLVSSMRLITVRSSVRSREGPRKPSDYKVIRVTTLRNEKCGVDLAEMQFIDNVEDILR